MIEQQQKLMLSPYMEIYELVIPKDNLLRQIKELVDFSFIYDELLANYCLDNGRNAVPPIRMFKYLLLKSIYDLSDVDVVERSKYDMSFKYFLDMAPEDEVINPSSLTKFRKLRLKDMNLLDMLIAKTVQLALEKGIIKSKSIIVDATHTKSRYNQKTPRQVLQEQSKKLRRSIYEIDETMKEKFPDKNTEDSLEKELEKNTPWDDLHEECGVFGMYDFDGHDVASTIYYGLFALQHRGQESCGIAVSKTDGPKGKVTTHKDMGLVNEVFTQDILESMKGDIGVGHVRYSTAGASTRENAQPLVLNYVKGTLGLAHNGNLINANELRRELEYTGAIFQTTIDSEVIAYHIARERLKSKTVEEAVGRACRKLKGAYSLVVISQGNALIPIT